MNSEAGCQNDTRQDDETKIQTTCFDTRVFHVRVRSGDQETNHWHSGVRISVGPEPECRQHCGVSWRQLSELFAETFCQQVRAKELLQAKYPLHIERGQMMLG